MVELMVVVIIIAVVAALTIPNITRRMRERRSSEAAHRVMLLYQEARMTAMGRGTAVLVRYSQPTVMGAMEVRIAQAGTVAGAGCEELPVPSCTSTDWNNPAPRQFRTLTSFDVGIRAEYDRVHIEMFAPDGDTPDFVDICFSPMGRTFVRENQNLGFTALTGIYRADVFRADGAIKLGRTRRVMVLPNGAARLQ